MKHKKLSILLCIVVLILVVLSGCQQHEHAYGEWVVTTASTCTTEGTETRTCECGDTQTQTVSATGHQWNDATCSKPKTCGACDATEGSAIDHNYAEGACTMCGAEDPVAKQQQLFNGTYLFLTTIESKCDSYSSMIYDAWYFAIYQCDDYYSGASAIDAYSRNVGIDTAQVTEGVDSYLRLAGYTPSDDYRWAVLNSNEGALYVLNYALTKSSSFSDIEEAFATAKSYIQSMDPAYSSINAYSEISSYYNAVSAYFDFCCFPSGSFSQLANTVNTYRFNCESCRNKCDWYFKFAS